MRPVPQLAMSIYMGNSSSSQKRKKSRKSREVKTPITAVCSSNSQMKYSLTRSLMDQEAITAQKPSSPVSNTMGALRPSTPRK